jgi:molybdate transport system ATP-binding protein
MDFDALNPNRFAAVVYDDGKAVDALMSAFAAELVAAGVAARGIVQLPPEAPGCGPGSPMRVRVVESGELLPICQDLGPGAASCKLDSSALAGAAVRLRECASLPSDILFFSKFGKQEANGGGFRAEFGYAISAGRTVLTAVKRPLTAKWLEFTGDRGTLLDARAWVLRAWWRELNLPRRLAA